MQQQTMPLLKRHRLLLKLLLKCYRYFDRHHDRLVHRCLRERNWDQLVPLYRELEFNFLLKQAPKEISKPTVKTTKKAQVQEATLDLFASIETPSESIVNDEVTNPNPQIEDRLAAYLLNPELAFNPNIPVQWDALKADSALSASIPGRTA